VIQPAALSIDHGLIARTERFAQAQDVQRQHDRVQQQDRSEAGKKA